MVEVSDACQAGRFSEDRVGDAPRKGREKTMNGKVLAL